jgi:hypothetical protein
VAADDADAAVQDQALIQNLDWEVFIAYSVSCFFVCLFVCLFVCSALPQPPPA